MTTTIYWSPWYRGTEPYTDNYLAHYNIEGVYQDLVKDKETRNVSDNFFNCHAFKSFCKNLYFLRNPYTIDFKYIPEEGRVISNKQPKGSLQDLAPLLGQNKQPSVKNGLTINYSCNWIFFADKPVQLQTMAPFMHENEIYKTSYYVPGMYDISQWFRPFELALQMKPGQRDLKSIEGEPVVYVKFHTDDNIKLKRVFLTQELINHSMSCVNLKKFKTFRTLPNLYKIFNASYLRKKVLRELENNVLENL